MAIELIARGVWRRGGCILLCKNAREGYFYLPGGHIESGETTAQALAREFKEETGASVQVGEFLGAAECRFVQEGESRHEVSELFHVEQLPFPPAPPVPPAPPASPDITSLEADIEFAWVRIEDIADLDLRPRVIRAWLASGAAGGSPAFLYSVEV